MTSTQRDPERLPEEAELTPEQALAKTQLQIHLAAQARGTARTPLATRARSLVAARATIRTPPSQRITPARHVQSYADALLEATGIDSYGTYFGHSPTPERAVDVFVPVSPKTLGVRGVEWTLANWSRFGVRYVIYRQTEPGFGINWNDGRGWRRMEDRGNNTVNHFDHFHTAFETSAPDLPAPPPAPIIQEDDMKFRYWSKRGGLRVSDGTNTSLNGLDPAVSEVMDKLNKSHGAFPILDKLTDREVEGLDRLPPFPGE